MNIILLKTRPEHLRAVVDNAKHALNGRLQRAQAGDILLIAESPPPKLRDQVQYAMRYRRMYVDTANDAEAIWGRQWRYIVEGNDCCRLDRPFSIGAVQVSSKNYGRGAISFVYLDELDVKALMEGSFLRPLL